MNKQPKIDPENPIFGLHDDQTLQQFNDVLSRAERGALMADGHLGYVMPIGGVMAYRNKVSPVGVGFDIGCGNMAVKLDLKADEFNRGEALDLIEQEITFGVGNDNPRAPGDHEILHAPEWEAYHNQKVRDELKKLAQKQLGSVGGGNHYVDLLRDEEGYIWIGTHFGSRGFGHKTASGFMNLSLGRSWSDNPKQEEVLLDLDTPLGQDYFAAMQLAGRYAYAGREWVCNRIAEAMGCEILDTVHNNHNFAWKEEHGGEELVVVRKGATPAFPDQRGFVGGSMADQSVILKGVDTPRSRKSLYSTVHGAGRVMSRTQARGGYRRRNLQKASVTPQMMHEELRKMNVALRGGGLDEAPQVYRKLQDVLNAHSDTVKIEHRLYPVGVVMDGPERLDP